MKPSRALLNKLKKTNIPHGYIKMIVDDFDKAYNWKTTGPKVHKAKFQKLIDLAFDAFLSGNLNATDMNTRFGAAMSPFLAVSDERNGSRSRTKSTK